MNKFYKVSYEQFVKDCTKQGLIATKAIYDTIELPKRSSVGSAGYDIRTPFKFTLWNDEQIVIPTGLRVELDDNKFLAIVPRSGIGFKTGIRLANTIGIIDASYFYSDNEGHIMLKLCGGFKEYTALANERVVQGIILPFDITSDDETTNIRNGGFGSSGRN